MGLQDTVMRDYTLNFTYDSKILYLNSAQPFFEWVCYKMIWMLLGSTILKTTC